MTNDQIKINYNNSFSFFLSNHNTLLKTCKNVKDFKQKIHNESKSYTWLSRLNFKVTFVAHDTCFMLRFVYINRNFASVYLSIYVLSFTWDDWLFI